VIDEADWEYTDEDWVRDAFLSLNHYGRWRLTGEHDFIYMRPGLDPGRVSADHMAVEADPSSGALVGYRHDRNRSFDLSPSPAALVRT
jgi:hypothetical protein